MRDQRDKKTGSERGERRGVDRSIYGPATRRVRIADGCSEQGSGRLALGHCIRLLGDLETKRYHIWPCKAHVLVFILFSYCFIILNNYH